MCAEERDQHDLRDLDRRLVGPAQKALQLRLARERVAERPEMQREEERERHARYPVDGEGPPGGVAAGAEVVFHRGDE